MLEFKRYALIGCIFVVLFLLLVRWNEFSNEREKLANTKLDTLSSTETTAFNNETIEGVDNRTNTSAQNYIDIPSVESKEIPAEKNVVKSSGLVDVKTDVLQIKIDPLGGDIVMASLPTYWAALDTPDIPFELLNRTSEKTYIAQSGLVGKSGTDKPEGRPFYKSTKKSYVLKEGEDRLLVDLRLQQEKGISITKRFIFNRGDFLVTVEYLVDNKSPETWQAAFFGQIKRDGSVPKSTATGLQPFLGAATSTSEERYLKMDFDDMQKEAFKETIEGGWISMVQHYFISAWIGNPDEENTYRAKMLSGDQLYVMGYTGPIKTIPANSSGKLGGRFYAGPKITQRLEEISPYLDLTVDYGWLWWVAKPIHWVLQLVFSIIQNWGWSIVVLTLMIKTILFPLSHKAYVSMGHMRKVAPKMALIKEQCGDNRQKLQEEMMKLYRTEKINPLGGCFPMLLQMPVFISLYWVLMESVELRHAPFMGWIEDLSVMDPYFCLPILMGISMFLQQKMNPAPPDPMQAKVMQWLPIVFTLMFLWFPAGLVLYWLVNNIISMVHQGYVNKRVESGAL